MKNTVICLLLAGCGSITSTTNMYIDTGTPDADTPVIDASKNNEIGATTGTGGTTVSVDAGTGGSGTGGSISGTGGATLGTGGSSGSGGSPAGTACGLDLAVCPDTVRSVYYKMIYALSETVPQYMTGPREPRICAINLQGMTVIDDKEVFNDVRCGHCLTGTASGKRGVYSCLIRPNTMINVSMQQPVTNDIAIFCLPPNGVCPDTGVMYTKWRGPDMIGGEQ